MRTGPPTTSRNASAMAARSAWRSARRSARGVDRLKRAPSASTGWSQCSWSRTLSTSPLRRLSQVPHARAAGLRCRRVQCRCSVGSRYSVHAGPRRVIGSRLSPHHRRGVRDNHQSLPFLLAGVAGGRRIAPAAVVTMMKKAMRFENVIPIQVSMSRYSCRITGRATAVVGRDCWQGPDATASRWSR